MYEPRSVGPMHTLVRGRQVEAEAMSSPAGGSSSTDDLTTHNIGVLLNLLFFSALMCAVPCATFILSEQRFLDSLYEHTFGIPADGQRIIYSGLAAVASVNLVIAAFVIKAFREPPPPAADPAKKRQ